MGAGAGERAWCPPVALQGGRASSQGHLRPLEAGKGTKGFSPGAGPAHALALAQESRVRPPASKPGL